MPLTALAVGHALTTRSTLLRRPITAMFKVRKNHSFTVSVEVLTPVDGGHEREEFRATFKLLDAEELNAQDLLSMDGQKAFLAATFVKGTDLTDEDGKTLPWSDAVRDAIIANVPARQGLIAAYTKALNSGEARAKN